MAGVEQVASAVAALDLGPLGERLRGHPSYLVGGAAREIVAGHEPGTDIDIAVEGEVAPIVAGLEEHGATRTHDRFGTATVPLAGGRHADLARTRVESYPEPGALPEVEPATIAEDLARRDFTVNAIAIPLEPPFEPIDPFGGAADLERGVLRALHDDSFRDDPTRAVRAARYASRLGLSPEERTLAGLRATDLGSVSADRRRAELARLAAEPSAARGFALLADWGVMAIPRERLDLIAAVDSEAAGGWSADDRAEAILEVASGGPALARGLELARRRPGSPSAAVAAAAGATDSEQLVGAAAGAAWIEDYRDDWRHVTLEIGGDDLIAAGIDPGPAIGAGLTAALSLKLDGRLAGGREAELRAALGVARSI